MKNHVIVLLFFGANVVLAQQSSVSGVIAVFNSQYKTGKRQYVDKAQVEETYKKSQATTTNSEGAFHLPLVGIKDLEKIDLSVKKKNYEVVNLDALHAIAGQKEWIRLWMSPEGEWAEMQLKYYKINRDALEKALTQKLQGLGQEIELLSQNKEQNQAKLQALQTEYGNLQEQYKHLEKQAREMAERYAKVNLDDQSKEYQKAFRYFEKGELEKALESLEKTNLEQASGNIIAEQRRNKKLNKEYVERDSAKNVQKQQVTAGLLFKARLYETKFEFDKEEKTFQLLLRLDSTNVNSFLTFAGFLLTQNKTDEASKCYFKAEALAETDEIRAEIWVGQGALYCREYDQNSRSLGRLLLYNAYRIRVKLHEANPTPQNLAYLLNIISYLTSDYVMIHISPQELGKWRICAETLPKLYFSLANENPKYLPALAWSLNNLGQFYLKMNEPLRADTVLGLALGLYQKLTRDKKSDEFLPEIVIVLNTIGVLYYGTPLAETLFLESLKISRQLAAKNPNVFLPNVVLGLTNLGNQYQSNKIPEANAALNEAVKIARQLADLNPHFLEELAYALHNLGTFHTTHYQFPQAVSTLEEALKLSKQLADLNPESFFPLVARTSNSLGILYKNFEKYDKALVYYKEAIQIQEKAILNGKTNFFTQFRELLSDISQVSDSADAKGNYVIATKALQLIAEGCDTLRNVKGTAEFQLLSVAVVQYISLSWAALLAKDYELSEKSALRILALDPSKEEVALVFLGHSQLLRGQFQVSLATYKKRFGNKNPKDYNYKNFLLKNLTILQAGNSHPDILRMRAEIEKW